MDAQANPQPTLDALTEAIRPLDLASKQRLVEILEQQILEEEERYETDPSVLAEVAEAREAYEAGDYQTLEDYVARRSKS